MSKIKDELNPLIGDTTNPSNQLKESIRQPKKSKKSSLSLTLVSTAVILVMGLIVYSFFNNETVPSIVAPPDNGLQETEISIKQQLNSMFMENGQYSFFAGDGGEYSSYTQITYWLDENHVQLVKDNTAVIAMELYRITDDEIQLLLTGVYNEAFTSDQLISYKDFAKLYISRGELPFDPTNELSFTLTEALNKIKPLETNFRLPLKIDDTIENYKVVDILDELTVSYGSFKQVYVLEERTEDFIITNYFASPGGFIQWSHQMIDDDFQINGQLHSIFGNWAANDSQIQIKSLDQKVNKNISLTNYPILKTLLLHMATTEEIVNQMFYIPIPSSISTLELFMIKIPSYGGNYLNFLIFKQNDEIKEIPLGESYGKKEPVLHFSPSGNYLIYRLDVPYVAEENNPDYLITQLILINLSNQSLVYPREYSLLFDIVSIPITTIQWTSDTTFTVDVADILENSYYEVEQWYKNEARPTNTIEFTLE